MHTLLAGNNCAGGIAGGVVALQYAWHSSSNSSVMRALMLYAMADWYVRTPEPLDLERLLRVFDVAHQLKPSALQPLLNSTTFAFSIDLACLAARRDMIKLDGWITPKLREHGVRHLYVKPNIDYGWHRNASQSNVQNFRILSMYPSF